MIDTLLAIFSFLLGSCLASFGGVVAFRCPKGQSIVKPDSYCPSCHSEIKWYDNIPIVSYLILGGKCRNCKSKIGFFSFLSELLCGLLYLLAFLQFGVNWKTLILFLLFFLFVVIANIDYETHDIYDVTLVIFAVLALALALYKILAEGADVWSHVIGCVAGFGVFFLIKVVAKAIAKQEALGAGDVYLAGIAGAMLGGISLLFAVMVATVIGSIVELVRIKTSKEDVNPEIAFGPYLLLGFALMAIYGDTLIELYQEVLL
ncbi:MAG: prepilin peptidase [Clostridia bacterium]|nr:prepilin peptidase [Clostridia bacterium]